VAKSKTSNFAVFIANVLHSDPVNLVARKDIKLTDFSAHIYIYIYAYTIYIPIRKVYINQLFFSV